MCLNQKFFLVPLLFIDFLLGVINTSCLCTLLKTFLCIAFVHVILLTGPVLVTKNPSLHPGDVRKLEAVDVTALHHIKDCIVFPAQGKRPHPDEMAGNVLIFI